MEELDRVSTSELSRASLQASETCRHRNFQILSDTGVANMQWVETCRLPYMSQTL